jgi:hypothetical protein
MKGFIGFFDILGYSSFLESDTTIGTAEEVLRIITSSGKRADYLNDMVLDLLPNGSHEIYKNGPTITTMLKAHKSESSWTIWSDSIVLTVPFEPASEITIQGLMKQMGGLFHAASTAGMLAEQMYLAGLPVRGVLHFGEYYKKDSCLAGKALIEAYRLCNKIDLAATVITPAAMTFCRVDLNEHGSFDLSRSFAQNYAVPLNDGQQEIMPVITCVDWRLTSKPTLHEAVYNSFASHGKAMTGNAPRKADNTIKLWQSLPARPSTMPNLLMGDKESI